MITTTKIADILTQFLGRILWDFVSAFIDLVVAFCVLASIILPSYYLGYWFGVPLTIALIGFILFLGRKVRQKKVVHANQ